MSSFAVPADAYDRFMGRYSVLLGRAVRGPGRNRGRSAGARRRLRAGRAHRRARRPGRRESVAAVDPSEPFVAAARSRNTGVDVQQASAEELPYPDASFDAALAQLVVQFMADPTTGIAEMRRVTRPDGVVAACVWDHAGGQGPLSPFWDAARDLDPEVQGEGRFVGTQQGDLAGLFEAAGLHEVEETALSVGVEHPTFEEWWEPFTLGVGPAGVYVKGLEPARREALRERCRATLPEPPFVLTAQAWAARGLV